MSEGSSLRELLSGRSFSSRFCVQMTRKQGFTRASAALSRSLLGAIFLFSPFLSPISARAQASDALRFPLLHSESYPQQPALGQAWAGVAFGEGTPLGVPDSLDFPAETEWGEVRVTPRLRLLLAREPSDDSASGDYSVFSIGDRGLKGEARIQAPDSGQVQVNVSVSPGGADGGDPGVAPLPVRIQVSSSGRVEYQISGIWAATLELDGERLAIGVQRLAEEAAIVFADADSDWVYEQYVQSNSPLGLGGRFWTIAADFSEGQAVLQPTDRTPVDAGWDAPDLYGPVWGGEGTFLLSENLGRTVVLVFCYQRCFACRGIRPDLEGLSKEFGGDSGVDFVSVVTSEEEAAGNSEMISPGWAQVVSPGGWSDFAVSPTPTLFVVDPDGIIAYRRVGGGPELAPEVADVVRKGQRKMGRGLTQRSTPSREPPSHS